MTRVAILIGCGAAKRRRWEWPADVESALHDARGDVVWRTIGDDGRRRYTDRFAECVGRGYPRFRAQNLYTANYFGLKAEYAATFASPHSWGILSAEHGFLGPGEPVAPYETHIDDVNPDEWAARVDAALDDSAVTIRGADRIEMLAGRKYVEAVKPVLATTSAEVVYPFQMTMGLNGIGDQMGWLRDEIDAAHPDSVGAWTFHSGPACLADTADDAAYNGETWMGPAGDTSLTLFEHNPGAVYVAVHDRRDGVRCQGHRIDLPDDATRKEAFRAAVAWMHDHDPREWTCPSVASCLLDAPPGFDLDVYYPDGRGERVRYQNVAPPIEERTASVTLIVDGYRTSGNYEVAVRRNDESKRPFETDAISLPDGAGVEMSALRARHLAADLVDAENAHALPADGQASLGDYAPATTDGGTER